MEGLIKVGVGVGVGRAVHHEAVADSARSRDTEVSGIAGSGDRCGDSRTEYGQLFEIAAVERQIGDGPVVDHGTLAGGIGFQNGRRGGDLTVHPPAESRLAHRQGWSLIVARGIGGDSADGIGFQAADFYRGVGYDRLSVVGNGAGDGAESAISR